MKIALEESECHVSAIALALHLGLGTEDPETENFIEAAKICVLIAEARNKMHKLLEETRDTTLKSEIELTDVQVGVFTTSLSYALTFYDPYRDPEEIRDARAVLNMLVYQEVIAKTNEYFNRHN